MADYSSDPSVPSVPASGNLDCSSGLPALTDFPAILIRSVCETMVPKLVAEDIPLLFSLVSDVFPGIEYNRAQMTTLKKLIRSPLIIIAVTDFYNNCVKVRCNSLNN
ncbi:dynein axonemal heavy chain 11-like [Hyalella azteca]|uniref:Dynein axonemal heavy chain 11-like n=1 Tax=Hyalella azteca TaxID=294128 RepID=A0A979FIN3_HYAAZ|nr:dynein axonemal heavy chain 11-like [Hyalella azteca]